MREYALVCAVSAAVTWLLTPLARVFALRVGALAAIRDRDVHAVPTPRMGGLAMYVGMLSGLLVASRLPTLSGVFRSYSEPRAVAIAGGAILVLGLIDDRWGLDALTKLAGQIASVGLMVLLGVQLSFFFWPGGSVLSLDQTTAVPLTVLLAVVMINAINFIDGLDGLAAGVAAIAAIASWAYSYQLLASLGVLRAGPSSLIAAVTAGVCLGFLPHNFSPARLFMGDSGSMLIGLMLAASMISVTGQVNFSGLAGTTSAPLLVPLVIPVAVLAVPFVDLVMAVIRRTAHGRSPFAPDKLHLHHRLLEIGHSQRRAVLLMYSWSGLLAFGGVAVSFSHGPAAVLYAMASVALVVLLIMAVPRLRASRSR